MKRKSSRHGENLAYLEADFYNLRDPQKGKKRIKEALASQEVQPTYLDPWLALSKENEHVYPSQGLLRTPFDYLEQASLQMLPQEKIIKTLRLRRFFLELFNHPYRTSFLQQVTKTDYIPPPKIESKLFEWVNSTGLSLSIGDFGAIVVGAQKDRTSRTKRYAQGPFIKIGKQARIPFVGSASPDVWNSSFAISTMAASHCIAGIPRNGVLSDMARQADVASEVFDQLKQLEKELLTGRGDRASIAQHWRHNVCATIEADKERGLTRASKLFSAGVRTFRVYSPEPGIGPIDTVKALRKKYGDEIEIFSGQVVDVGQAKAIQKAGADGIYLGIGGGGRCITGVRSGSVVDWPLLAWNLRGEISIPVLVEGGGTDHVAVTLLLGVSGIGVSRAVAGGTIESPGGALFCSDGNGRLYKPYGGEASARTKFLDGKLLPFDVPSFVEGETTKAYMSYVKHVLPTLTYNLHLLIEDSILAMVFRNSSDIYELYSMNPSPLRQSTNFGFFQRGSH